MCLGVVFGAKKTGVGVFVFIFFGEIVRGALGDHHLRGSLAFPARHHHPLQHGAFLPLLALELGLFHGFVGG